MSNVHTTSERPASRQRRGALIGAVAAISVAVAAAAVVVALQVGGSDVTPVQSAGQTTQQHVPQDSAPTSTSGGEAGDTTPAEPQDGSTTSTGEAPSERRAYGDGVLSFEQVADDLDPTFTWTVDQFAMPMLDYYWTYIGSTGWIPLNGYAGVDPGEQLYCDGTPVTDGDGLHSFHDNAMYCGPHDDLSFGDGRADLHDYIVYDTRFLRDDVLARYGDMALTFVLAHEYGHAAQARFGWVTGDTPVQQAELNADCLAGTFVRWLYDNGYVDSQLAADQLGQFIPTLGGYDVNGNAGDHGTPEDRIAATEYGYANGVMACAAYIATRLADPARPLRGAIPGGRAVRLVPPPRRGSHGFHPG
jgi:predicted metalloprotease